MRPHSDKILRDATNSLAEGQSVREVAAHLNISKSYVANVRKGMDRPPSGPKSGPKPKLTERERAYAASLIRRNKAKTAVDATIATNQIHATPVSVQTVRRALKDQELRSIKKKKRPLLTKPHRRARLQWAVQHKDWTVDDWKAIIFSDESKFNRLCSDGVRF